MAEQVKKGEKLACESCGKEFVCGAGNDSCWCFDVSLKPESLEELREKFKNCLCADCLKNQFEIFDS